MNRRCLNHLRHNTLQCFTLEELIPTVSGKIKNSLSIIFPMATNEPHAFENQNIWLGLILGLLAIQTPYDIHARSRYVGVFDDVNTWTCFSALSCHLSLNVLVGVRDLLVEMLVLYNRIRITDQHVSYRLERELINGKVNVAQGIKCPLEPSTVSNPI